MQCANGLKRRLQEEEQLRSRAKRTCLEAQNRPMETSPSLPAANQHPELQVSGARPGSALCCPRCLGGEPGHIRHISGL
ncbi:uncharacterized protein ACNS7B_003325 isoform 1-T9 [Menidia menidia]